MSLENLVKEGKVKSIKSSKQEIKEILSLAERDLKMAEFVINQDWDWAFSISYNAVLQASRAYMYSKGYRASSHEAHKSTFEFMKLSLGRGHEDLIGFFDRMRPKRNRAIYDTAGLITETEVRELLKKAKDFVAIINDKLKGR